MFVSPLDAASSAKGRSNHHFDGKPFRLAPKQSASPLCPGGEQCARHVTPLENWVVQAGFATEPSMTCCLLLFRLRLPKVVLAKCDQDIHDHTLNISELFNAFQSNSMVWSGSPRPNKEWSLGRSMYRIPYCQRGAKVWAFRLRGHFCVGRSMAGEQDGPRTSRWHHMPHEIIFWILFCS